MSTTTTTAQQPTESANLEAVMSWLKDVKEEAPADPVIEQQATQVVTQMLSVKPEQTAEIAVTKKTIENLGVELQREAARRSAMLKQPVSKLYKDVSDGGPVANALVDLRLKVEELDPAKVDFSPGWLSRTLGLIPLLGTPIKRYVTRFESTQTQLDAIVASLEQGRKQLERDNVTLEDDQEAMRALAKKLEQAVKLGQTIDTQLSSKVERELAVGDPKRAVIESEWLFPLRQRIQDLQQQLLVNQQGVMALGVVRSNNVELVRGVNRATTVTVSALNVALTTALALANQKIVIDKVKAVNETTDSLIAQNAERLRTQGTEIHKMAASSSLNPETLKKAFEDIRAALDDISKFRQESLPKMASTIVELDKLSSEAGRTLENMDNARRIGTVINEQLGQSIN
jgi:uncharacterized protein YaaN involved in tellurite resistance